MKKLLSITTAGLAVLAIAGSAFAATPSTTSTTAASISATAKPAAVDFQHKHGGKFTNEELLTLLKIDADTLHQELKAGKSLADIAAAQGVDKQKVIDLMVKQATERLNQAVQAGKLTQAQADEKKAELQEKIKERVENKGGFGFKVGHGRGGKHLGEAASVLGVDEKDLLTQLQSGKTLAQIAESKGISKADLIDKLLEKEKERLTQMVDQSWPQKENKSTQTEQTN